MIVVTGSALGSSGWTVARNLGALLALVFWLVSAIWVYKDARRRVAERWLVAAAALLGLFPPYIGPLVYLFLRPPESLEERRERRLEMRAIEQRLAERALACPVCRAAVEPAYLVCPVCTTRLKHACATCSAPLDAIWQVCPYCATPVPPTVALGEVEPLRARRQGKAD